MDSIQLKKYLIDRIEHHRKTIRLIEDIAKKHEVDISNDKTYVILNAQKKALEEVLELIKYI